LLQSIFGAGDKFPADLRYLL